MENDVKVEECDRAAADKLCSELLDSIGPAIDGHKRFIAEAFARHRQQHPPAPEPDGEVRDAIEYLYAQVDHGNWRANNAYVAIKRAIHSQPRRQVVRVNLTIPKQELRSIAENSRIVLEQCAMPPDVRRHLEICRDHATYALEDIRFQEEQLLAAAPAEDDAARDKEGSE